MEGVGTDDNLQDPMVASRKAIGIEAPAGRVGQVQQTHLAVWKKEAGIDEGSTAQGEDFRKRIHGGGGPEKGRGPSGQG